MILKNNLLKSNQRLRNVNTKHKFVIIKPRLKNDYEKHTIKNIFITK